MRYGATHRGFESLPLRHRPRRVHRGRHAGPASPSWWWTRRPRGTWLPATDRPSTPRSRAGPSRCVIGWRARPETFAACGFSDLRARFVLRDESSRRQRSRALHGSGRAAPEHDAGSPTLGTRPQPRGVLRSTNCARISEEPDAGTRADGVRHSPAQRRRPSRAPCYDPVAVLGGELAVPCTCNPL